MITLVDYRLCFQLPHCAAEIAQSGDRIVEDIAELNYDLWRPANQYQLRRRRSQIHLYDHNSLGFS